MNLWRRLFGHRWHSAARGLNAARYCTRCKWWIHVRVGSIAALILLAAAPTWAWQRGDHVTAAEWNTMVTTARCPGAIGWPSADLLPLIIEFSRCLAEQAHQPQAEEFFRLGATYGIGGRIPPNPARSK